MSVLPVSSSPFKDEGAFRNIMLLCVGVGAVCSLIFHLLVKEDVDPQVFLVSCPVIGSPVFVEEDVGSWHTVISSLLFSFWESGVNLGGR